MSPCDWQQLWGTSLNSYMEQQTNLILIALDQNLAILNCNQSFLRLLNLEVKPLGRHLGDFLLPETLADLELPPPGELRPCRLSFPGFEPAVQLLDGRILQTGSAWLIVGERLLITESNLLRQIAKLNQQLTNLSRELYRRHQVLQEAMIKLQRATAEKEQLIQQYQQSLLQVKTLRGLLPICAACKRIRNDAGYWQQLEAYFTEHSEVEFSHGICPECATWLYGDYLEERPEASSSEGNHESDP